MPDPTQVSPKRGATPLESNEPIRPPSYLKVFHDGFAAIFDQRRPFCPELGQRICSILDLKPGKRYLDICSGTGLYAQHPFKAGAEVTCLEPDSSLIEQAKSKFGDRATYEQIPAQSFAPITRFDAAGMVNGMHLLLKQGQGEAVMTRLRDQILIPNGKVIVAFCDRKDMMQQPHVQFFLKDMERIAFTATVSVRAFLENTAPGLGYSLISREEVATSVRVNTKWLSNFIADRATSTLQRICNELGPEAWQRRLDEIINIEIPKIYPTGEVNYGYAITLFAFRAES